MTTVKVRKISNPRRTANRRHFKRRKMSDKQIAIFGTKRQKAALKERRRHNQHRKRTDKNSRSVTRNPSLVLTLGSMANPRRKRRKADAKKRSNKTMAATKNNRRRSMNKRHYRRNTKPSANRRRHERRRNPAPRINRHRRHEMNRRHHHRRRNGPKIIVMRPNRRKNRRHNPQFGQSIFAGPLFGRNALELMGGGLLGLVAAKFIPTMFASSIPSAVSGTNIGRVIISGIAAVIAGWAGSKISIPLGQGMLFGGMIQTISVALNAFLPSVYSQLNPSLGRLGDLAPGSYVVPQNPIRDGMPVALPAPAVAMTGGQVRMSAPGLGRAGYMAY